MSRNAILSFDIVQCGLDGAGDLSAFYNEQLAGVEQCFPVAAEEFREGLAWRQARNGPREKVSGETLFVARSGADVLGFAHAARRDLEIEGRIACGGAIRFLTYRPSHRPAGQVLLDECEAYLYLRGAREVRAFPKSSAYPFHHLGAGMLSDRTAHVSGLLGLNGYEPIDGAVFLARRTDGAPRPSIPVGDSGAEVVAEPLPGPGRLPGLTVRAVRNGEEIGVCRSVSAGSYSRAARAQQSFLTESLAIAPAHRGRGWGRFLLLRCLWEMRRIGYRDGLISADWTNHRALLCFTDCGYRAIDTVRSFVKVPP